jgi:hypothetical protein
MKAGRQAGGGSPPRGPIPETHRIQAPGFPSKSVPARLTGGAALPAGLHFTAGDTIARSREPWCQRAFSRSVRTDHIPSLYQWRCSALRSGDAFFPSFS